MTIPQTPLVAPRSKTVADLLERLSEKIQAAVVVESSELQLILAALIARSHLKWSACANIALAIRAATSTGILQREGCNCTRHVSPENLRKGD